MCILYACSDAVSDLEEVKKTFSADIKHIEIKVGVSDVSVKRGTQNDIVFTYYDRGEAEDKFTVTEDTLDFEREYYWSLGEAIIDNGKYFKVTLELPENYSGELEISTESGDIDINGVKFISAEDESGADVHLETSTGVVTIHDSSFEGLDIDGTTSDVIMKNTDFKSAKISTVTGDVYIADGNALAADIETETASIDLDNFKAETLNASAKSGSLNITKVTVTEKIDISSLAGDIEAKSLSVGSGYISGIAGAIYLNGLSVTKSLTIENNVGEITAKLSGKRDGYKINAISELGKNNMQDVITTGSSIINIKAITGNITVEFEK